MAIQVRRGPFSKLNTSKLLPGEWAIVLEEDPLCKDGKSIYACFKAGDTKRMATFEDMKENIEIITDQIEKIYTAEIKKATQDAIDIKNLVQDRLDNGDFIGPQGPQGPQGIQGIQGAQGVQGPQGDRGDSGISVPISGMFTLSGDEDGNLWAYYIDGDSEPVFKVDDNGNIYYVTPEI